jgi:hypothetical protein
MIYAPIQLADGSPAPSSAPPTVQKCAIDSDAIDGSDFKGTFRLLFKQATGSGNDCTTGAKVAMGIIGFIIVVFGFCILWAICAFTRGKV